jgi:uridylate kinase
VLLWDVLMMHISVTVVNAMLLTDTLTTADLPFDLQASFNISVLSIVSLQKASSSMLG